MHEFIFNLQYTNLIPLGIFNGVFGNVLCCERCPRFKHHVKGKEVIFKGKEIVKIQAVSSEELKNTTHLQA